jgi:hypothetical protein
MKKRLATTALLALFLSGCGGSVLPPAATSVPTANATAAGLNPIFLLHNAESLVAQGKVAEASNLLRSMSRAMTVRSGSDGEDLAAIIHLQREILGQHPPEQPVQVLMQVDEIRRGLNTLQKGLSGLRSRPEKVDFYEIQKVVDEAAACLGDSFPTLATPKDPETHVYLGFAAAVISSATRLAYNPEDVTGIAAAVDAAVARAQQDPTASEKYKQTLADFAKDMHALTPARRTPLK